MSGAKQQDFLKKKLSKGMPISTDGLSDAINKMSRALSEMRVEGDDKIEASIDWSMGLPRIKIKWKGDTV